MPELRRALPLALLAVVVAGCGGENTLRPDGAEKSVVDLVSRETGSRPTDVKCPSDVEAKVGATFECSFTGPEGPYTAFMEVTKVDGEKVIFQIDTRRAR